MIALQTPLFVDGRSSETFNALLALAKVPHDSTLAGVNTALQAHWYQEGKLRAEIVEQMGHLRKDAWPLLGELGFVEAVLAPADEYTGVLFLGATLKSVQKRLAFLGQMWQGGVRFERFAILTSSRFLTEAENFADLPRQVMGMSFTPDDWLQPLTEADLINRLCMAATVPWDWSALEIQEAVATRIRDTRATANCFLKKFGVQPGRWLMISSQPFVSFQLGVLRQTLPQRSIRVLPTGYAAPESMPISSFFDNIAKCVYEEHLAIQPSAR